MIVPKLCVRRLNRHVMHMNLIGKELISERIMEHMKEQLTRRETSTITLQWNQELDKRTALKIQLLAL